jgi:hypothetical protein
MRPTGHGSKKSGGFRFFMLGDHMASKGEMGPKTGLVDVCGETNPNLADFVLENHQ